MTNGRAFDTKAVYEIRVLGMLDQSWSEWFFDFTITSQGEQALLLGSVPDQAALLGLLMKINNLGLTLIKVERKGE